MIDFKTEAELTAAGEAWQKYLRIQDWRITYRFVRPSEFGDAGQWGSIYCNTRNRSAEVKILHPDDWFDGMTMTATLVHELTHVILEPLYEDGDSSTEVLEGVTNHIMGILIGENGNSPLHVPEEKLFTTKELAAMPVPVREKIIQARLDRSDEKKK